MKYFFLINLVLCAASMFFLACENKSRQIEKTKSDLDNASNPKLKIILNEYKNVRLELVNESTIYSYNNGKVDDQRRKETLEKLESIKSRLTKIAHDVGTNPQIEEDLKSCRDLIAGYENAE